MRLVRIDDNAEVTFSVATVPVEMPPPFPFAVSEQPVHTVKYEGIVYQIGRHIPEAEQDLPSDYLAGTPCNYFFATDLESLEEVILRIV